MPPQLLQYYKYFKYMCMKQDPTIKPDACMYTITMTFLLHTLHVHVHVRPPHRVQEGHSIMTFVLSRNGRHALLNIATQVQYMILLLVCSPQTVNNVHTCRECMCGTFRTGVSFVATKVSLKATTISSPLLVESTTAS